jgi:hypothetical protein
MRLVLLSTPRSGSIAIAGLLFDYLTAAGRCHGLLHEFFDPFYFNCFFEERVIATMFGGFRGARADYHLEPGPGRFRCEFYLAEGQIKARRAAGTDRVDQEQEAGRRLLLLCETSSEYLLKSHAVELTYEMIDRLAGSGYQFAALERADKLDQILSWGIALANDRWVADDIRSRELIKGSLRYERSTFDAIVDQIRDYTEKKKYIGSCRELRHEMLVRPAEILETIGLREWSSLLPGSPTDGLPAKVNPPMEEKLAYFANSDELLRWYDEASI